MSFMVLLFDVEGSSADRGLSGGESRTGGEDVRYFSKLNGGGS